MPTLLEQAIDELRSLPVDTRDGIAHDILAMVRSAKEWDRLFSDPRSKTVLKSLADAADEDEIFAFDPASRLAAKSAE
jgi:hypothetical protein